jgi:ankyrin repeat protein
MPRFSYTHLFGHLRTLDELTIEQDEYVERFNKLLHSLDGVPRNELFAKFEEAWTQDSILKKSSWRETRGIFGETILHWINLQRPTSKGSFSELLFNIACELMDREPSLIEVVFQDEPYTGQSLLHMATGNSDEVLLAEILRRKKEQPEANVDLDARAEGHFFQSDNDHKIVTQRQTPEFVTPLCVAMVAPQDDDKCINIVNALLAAGASIIFKNNDGTIHSSALHHLAMARWSQQNAHHDNKADKTDSKEDGHLTSQRLKRLMHILLDAENGTHANHSSSYYGLTPLQLAAKVGNVAFINFLIRKEAVVMWKWGNKIEMRFCLSHLDSSGETWDQTSVLELLVLHKHKKTMCQGLMVDIMEHKWNMFGQWAAALQAIIMTSVVLLVTLSCLGAFSADVRMVFKVAAFVLSTSVLLYLVSMTFLARSSQWFKRITWFGNDMQLSLFELGIFRDFLVLLVVIVVLLLHLWEEMDERQNAERHRHIYIFIDEFTAVFIYIGWVDLLRFMGMFEVTSDIVSSLPRILHGDMLPWMIVYCIILVATTGAIRVAIAHTVNEGDANYNIMGTFFKTALTLEEATHGPDVSWRAIVIHSPVMAGVFFLIFLWVVTIVLFNILIAMITDTFERIRERSFRQRMHVRAVSLITQEKLMPSWLCKQIGLPMGLPFHQARGEVSAHAHQHKDVESADSHSHHGEQKVRQSKTRWLPIEQDYKNELWDQPMSNSVLW